MILLLSPAKTLDTSPSEVKHATKSRLLKQAQKLVDVLKEKSIADIQELMSVSEKIASLNVERYQQYKTPFSLKNAKQAVLLFKGDVYQGLAADTFDQGDLDFAQDHIRILSGLYGILRPLDLMQAYRLEMGTRLKNGNYKNLYEFWDKDITTILNKDIKASGNEIVLNLASKEYFKAIQPKLLKGKIVNVHFREERNGKYKVIAFNAKKARGAMANQIVKYKINEVAPLKDLVVTDYVYKEEMSKEGDLVFVK